MQKKMVGNLVIVLALVLILGATIGVMLITEYSAYADGKKYQKFVATKFSELSDQEQENAKEEIEKIVAINTIESDSEEVKMLIAYTVINAGAKDNTIVSAAKNFYSFSPYMQELTEAQTNDNMREDVKKAVEKAVAINNNPTYSEFGKVCSIVSSFSSSEEEMVGGINHLRSIEKIEFFDEREHCLFVAKEGQLVELKRNHTCKSVVDE